MPRWMRLLMLLVAMCLVLGPVPVAAAPPEPVGCASGSIGAGDAYYPTMGNGGYDARHYDLDLTLDVAGGAIESATVSIDMLALIDLCAFNLDFEGLTIDSVAVDGAAADFGRRGKELTVTPAAPLAAGSVFTVEVRYHGTPIAASFVPGPLVEATPAGGAALGLGGGDPDEFSVLQGSWFVGDDEIFIFGEPSGHRYWYPVNEHPVDKATYTARYTVAKPFDVVANGTLVETVDNGETTTFTWEARDPMASYLVMFHAGRLDIEKATTASGIPVLLSFEERVPEAQRAVIRRLPAMVDYAESIFGPYPFESIGAAVVGEEFTGLALETQTIPLYGSFAGVVEADGELPDRAVDQIERTLFHEIAHQWFGNAVSLQRWSDIWLNEGFAAYSEVLWAEHAWGEDARDQMVADRVRAASSPATIGDPGPAGIFSGEVYSRGALTLHALRLEVGDEAFFDILRTWAARYRNGNAATADFIAVSEELSGRDLRQFFDAWLFQPDLPDLQLDASAATAKAAGRIAA